MENSNQKNHSPNATDSVEGSPSFDGIKKQAIYEDDKSRESQDKMPTEADMPKEVSQIVSKRSSNITRVLELASQKNNTRVQSPLVLDKAHDGSNVHSQ